MKRYLLLLLLPLFSFAQNVTLSGTVKDAGGMPIPYAGIQFAKVNDTIIYATGIADEAGYFAVKAVRGNYILTVNSIGYSDYVVPLILNDETHLREIVLTEEATLLEAVTIANKRPIVKRKIDRLEFSVENSVLSSQNAWEILKKTPGVIASATGGLSIRGSSGIMVTINDKRIYMSGEELKQLLENTQGEDIKLIEVITNPPAKYEAQGSAVLNIKMKNNIPEGYKATVSGAYVQSMYPKGVIATSQYYKNKKLSLNGGYSLGAGTYIRQGEDVVHYLDDAGNTKSIWKSTLNRKNTSLGQNSYRLMADYAIDTLTTITAGVNGYIGINNTGEYIVPTYIYNGSGVLDSLYTTRNRRSNPLRQNAFSASLEHLFSKQEKIYISSDFTDYKSSENQDIYSVFSLPDNLPYRDGRFVSNNTNKITLFSLQADYSKEQDNTMLEAGSKFGKVSANNSLKFEDETNGTLVVNPQRTSEFIYDESIYAAYGSYSFEAGKWSFKGGLRSEYTQLKGNSVTTNEIREQKYFKVFPTAYIMFKPDTINEIGLTYGKRINRPQYTWLNPFRSYYNIYSYFTGDPGLQPAVIHNLSVLYTLNSKYNFDLFYRYEHDPSMEISYQDYETNTVIYRFTNIEKNYALGIDFNTSLAFFEWWEAGINTGLNYKKDTFQGLDGLLYTNARFTYIGSINNRFVLNKEKGFTAEADFYYASPAVQGTFTISSTSALSFSLRKAVMKSKGEVSLIVSDIYRGQKQKVTTDYANQYNYFYDYSDTQSFRIAFKYNIGNQSLKAARARENTEEQNRL